MSNLTDDMESSLSIFIRDVLLFRRPCAIGRRLVRFTWIGYLIFELLGAWTWIGAAFKWQSWTDVAVLLIWLPAFIYIFVRLALLRILLEVAVAILVKPVAAEMAVPNEAQG